MALKMIRIQKPVLTISQSTNNYNTISKECLLCSKINYYPTESSITKTYSSLMLNKSITDNVPIHNKRISPNSNTSIEYEQEINAILLQSHNKSMTKQRKRNKLPQMPRHLGKPKPSNQSIKYHERSKQNPPLKNKMLQKAFMQPKVVLHKKPSNPMNNSNNDNTIGRINISSLFKNSSMKIIHTNNFNKRLNQLFEYMYQRSSQPYYQSYITKID